MTPAEQQTINLLKAILAKLDEPLHDREKTGEWTTAKVERLRNEHDNVTGRWPTIDTSEPRE